MRYLIAILILLSLAPAHAADGDIIQPTVQFSATATQETGAVRLQQTIHYADGRLRIDRPNGFADTILDLNTQSEYLLMANHTYLVLPLDDQLYRRFFAFTVTTSEATRVGLQRIDGQTTTKYAFGHDGALDAAGYYWLTDTGIMIRRVFDDGVFGQNIHHVETLTNLTIAPQPPALFTIPPGYRLAK